MHQRRHNGRPITFLNVKADEVESEIPEQQNARYHPAEWINQYFDVLMRLISRL